MSNRTAPVLAAIILGAVALSPVFIKSFGNDPKIANIGLMNNQNGNSNGQVTAASNDVAKAGYSLGYMMGSNVKESAKDLNLADIDQGLSDGYHGKQAVMTREQMEQSVMAYQQHQIQQMSQTNLTKGQEFLAENAKKSGITTTASGLQYQVLKQGSTIKPKATDIVAVHYEGKLLDGKVFDSTAMHGGQPAVFPLNQVIPGWTEGLQLMGEGAKYRFFIPSKLAYGEQGAPQGGIEPNSVLIFDVELLKVNPPADAAPQQMGQADAQAQAQLQQQIEAQMGGSHPAQ